MSFFAISARYLFSKKCSYLPSFSVFIAFFGVFLSVSTLILVLSVMNGFKEDFEKLVIGTRPHITIYPQNPTFTDIETKIQSIQKNNDVFSVSKVVSGEGVLSFNNKTSGVMIKGVEENYFQTRKLLEESIVLGSFEENQVVIGIELAKKLGVNLGDTVTVISSKMRHTLFGTLPIHKSYQISGFFKVNMYIYDSTMLYLPLKDASALIFDDTEAQSNAIEVVLKNPARTENFYTKILQNKALQGSYITNWKNDNQSFIDAIATQTAVMFLILSLFLIISGFIIFSTISNIVNEKKRSIAVLQSFGMTFTQIITIFIRFGLMITIPAIILGAIFGSTAALNIENIKNWLETKTGTTIFDSAYYFLSYIPSTIHWESIYRVCIFAFIISLISVVIPALKTKKILPHEALRWE